MRRSDGQDPGGGGSRTRAILQRILAGHELVCAGIAQAEQLLRDQRFDLTVSTILFDESRMFDLLRLAKSRPEWKQIPFVCARLIPDSLNAVALEAVAFTCKSLGAVAFLNIADYQRAPEREIREAIEQFLGTQSGRETPGG